MELIIKQAKLKLNYEYKVFERDKLIYIGKVNRILIPSLRKIYLYELDGREVWYLRQENWFRIILRLLPLTCFFSFSVSPYIYHNNKGDKGYLREKINGDGYVYGQVEGKNFELWNHTENDISIFNDDKQVGLIKRIKLREFDGDKYKVLFNKTLEKHLAAIFCLLSDALWHTSDDKLHSISWEFSKELTGKKLDENWAPEE